MNIDPSSPDALTKLRDPRIVSAESIADAITTDKPGPQNGTFRGCVEPSWLPGVTDVMEWQRNGGFARALREKGVRSIVVGDLTEEWYLYSIAHPVKSMKDIELNLKRYYQDEFIAKTLAMYPRVPDGSDEEAFRKLFGQILSEGQVHLPVRLLARDLVNAGFPVLRYEIRWTPEQLRPFGKRHPLRPSRWCRTHRIGRICHARDRSSDLGIPATEPSS